MDDVTTGGPNPTPPALSIATVVQGPTVLIPKAIDALRANKSALGSLSPESALFVDALGGAIKTAISTLSTTGDLKAAAIATGLKVGTALATIAVSTALAAVKDTVSLGAGIVPVIGQFISFAIGLFTGFEEMKRQSAAELKAKNQEFERFLLEPKGSGVNLTVVPADLFACMVWNYNDYKHTMRSLLGQVLIFITESGLPREDPWKCNGIFEPKSPEDYKILLPLARKAIKDPRFGVPEDRRLLFRTLRQAIESQWKIGNTDGGASLWPAYVDLLVSEFDAGHLSEAGIQFLLSRLVDRTAGKPGFKIYTTGGSVLGAPAVMRLVDWWRATMSPVYAGDRTKRDREVATVQRLSRVATARRLGKTYFNASEIEGISREVLEALEVRIRPRIRVPGKSPAPLAPAASPAAWLGPSAPGATAEPTAPASAPAAPPAVSASPAPTQTPSADHTKLIAVAGIALVGILLLSVRR